MKKILLSFLLALPLMAQQPVQRNLSCSAAGASTTTYTCSITVAPSGYVTNQEYMFVADVANTAASTINFNGLGAKTIKKLSAGVKTDIVANDIGASMAVFMNYDGTDMVMTVPAGTSNSGGTVTNNNTSINMKCQKCTLDGTVLTEKWTNDTGTGTTTNKLSKLTGAPSKVVIIATTDTSGILGVCDSGCGTTSTAEITIQGIGSCVYDNSTVAGDYVVPSITVAGDCHDYGTSQPVGTQPMGYVLQTAAAGTRDTYFFGPSGLGLPAFVRNIAIPAAGCNATTGANSWDLPTSSAPAANCYGTSYRFGALDYDDAGDESATFHFMLPTGWTGAIDYKAWALVNGTTQSFKQTVATTCVAISEDALNPSFNTAQTITQASPGTANLLFTFSQAAITTTGCSAGEMFIVKVGRDTTDTSTATLSIIEVDLALRITPQP